MSRERKFKLAEAPRQIPLGILNRIFFGGSEVQTGYGIMAFGLLFTWIFVFDSELITYVQFWGERAHTEGSVTDIEVTNSSEDENTIIKLHYSYEVGGTSYQGASYCYSTPFNEGETAPIEYMVSRPHRSRIEGLRAHKFGLSVVFVVIFPLIGFGMVRGTSRKRRKKLRMLRDGVLRWGKFVSKEKTNTTVDNMPLYEVVYEYTSPGDKPSGNVYRGHSELRNVTFETYEPDRVTDDAREPLLCDPNDPEVALPFDALPWGVSVTREGQLESPETLKVALLITPLASVAFVIAMIISLWK